MQIAALSIIDEVIDTATYHLEACGDPVTTETLTIFLEAWDKTFIGQVYPSAKDYRAAIHLAVMHINQTPINNLN